MDVPIPPAVTESGAVLMIALDGLRRLAALKNKKQSTFSLRWLLAFLITFGLYVGGVARLHWARTHGERYRMEMEQYQQEPHLRLESRTLPAPAR